MTAAPQKMMLKENIGAPQKQIKLTIMLVVRVILDIVHRTAKEPQMKVLIAYDVGQVL